MRNCMWQLGLKLHNIINPQTYTNMATHQNIVSAHRILRKRNGFTHFSRSRKQTNKHDYTNFVSAALIPELQYNLLFDLLHHFIDRNDTHFLGAKKTLRHTLTHSLTHSPSYTHTLYPSLSHTHTHTHIHTHTFSLWITHTHTRILTLSLSLSHTHTNTLYTHFISLSYTHTRILSHSHIHLLHTRIYPSESESQFSIFFLYLFRSEIYRFFFRSKSKLVLYF